MERLKLLYTYTRLLYKIFISCKIQVQSRPRQCQLSQTNCTGPTHLSEAEILNRMHYSVINTLKIKGNLFKAKTCIRIHAMTEASSGHSFQIIANNQFPATTKRR